MAKRYWGSNKGDHQEAVQEGAATFATDVEVNINLASGLTRDEVLIQLQQIKNIIVQDSWPPA